MDYLSALRLGVHTGLIRNLTLRKIDAMMLATQPAHLPHLLGQKSFEPEERDRARAEWLRRELATVVTTFQEFTTR